ncbi:hypothetical protein LOK74_05900 [Brevibacillus humidisoli]|uniref:hypothetical protein n=1 Tax=Brevibacillus humidisoli TaxID=2895522 RepID=UPI001E2AE6B9|nr:hypothetical protein [Brevibacillus humidisoli]UFJ42031.1 hypothetical protein LOK74_05900 [Brevibacillus humidisoli]
MSVPIEVFRREELVGDRNVIGFSALSAREVYGSIREVESVWEHTGTNPVEWEYKAFIGFAPEEDIRPNDRLRLPGFRESFLVKNVQRTRLFLAVTAIRKKRGDI